MKRRERWAAAWLNLSDGTLQLCVLASLCGVALVAGADHMFLLSGHALSGLVAVLLGALALLCLGKIVGGHTLPRRCFALAVGVSIPLLSLAADAERKQFVRIMNGVQPGMTRAEVTTRVGEYIVRDGEDRRALLGLGSWSPGGERLSGRSLATVRWNEALPEYSNDVLLIAFDADGTVANVDLRMD